jgi:hypothetical protein
MLRALGSRVPQGQGLRQETAVSSQTVMVVATELASEQFIP